MLIFCYMHVWDFEIYWKSAKRQLRNSVFLSSGYCFCESLKNKIRRNVYKDNKNFGSRRSLAFAPFSLKWRNVQYWRRPTLSVNFYGLDFWASDFCVIPDRLNSTLLQLHQKTGRIKYGYIFSFRTTPFSKFVNCWSI